MNQEIYSLQAFPIETSISLCLHWPWGKDQEVRVWKKNKAASRSLKGRPFEEEEAEQSKKYPDTTMILVTSEKNNIHSCSQLHYHDRFVACR